MTSRFASKLGTNFCPLDEEVLEIQRLLVVPLSRLKDIDHELAELQKAIDELAEERDSVSAYVEAHKALLSPLRRLPLDIMQEIFVACLPTHRNCVMSAVEAPVLLGRICSSWRTVSLSTPRLWARLHIAEPERPRQAPIYQEKYAQRLAITKAWLERSGRCPLSISLHGSDLHRPGVSGNGLPEPVNRFLDLVLSYASRWQHISVTASALDTVFNLTEHDVPMLKTLEMRENNRSPPSIKNVSFGLLRRPEIYSFALDASETSPLALPLRWENLTSLCLINQVRRAAVSLFTSDEALNILSRCTRLRTCQFRLVESLTPPALEESILELPCLHSLEIFCIGAIIFSPGRLFSRILLPELRSFRFLSGVQTTVPQNLSFPFLAVSPKLEQLELELQLFSNESLLHFLSVLPPTIQRLLFLGHIVNTSPFDDAALTALTPSPDNPAVSCPSLQELEVGSCVALSDHAVLQFIKARMAVQPATLRRVVIQFQRDQQLDIRQKIQPFVNSGIEVSIRYPQLSVAAFSPWRGVEDRPPTSSLSRLRLTFVDDFSLRFEVGHQPLSFEVLEIQRLLVEPLSRLKGIDDEIAELKKTIDELTQERDFVSTYVEAHKALISPLRRLPLDIIQEIFVACLPTHRNCVVSAEEAPVLLGRICSSWRALSLSTPRLWARLHIAEPILPWQSQPSEFRFHARKHAQRVETTKAWLQRSGQCPLSLSFESSIEELPSAFDASSNPSLVPSADTLLQALLPYASRWQHFVLAASSSAYNLLSTLTEQDVPMLKTLEIHQHLMANSDLKSFGVLRGPKISSVTLTGNNGGLLHLPLRWESLTHLSITGHWHQWDQPAPALDINAALWMFSHCPSLRACQLLISEGNNPLPPQESRHSIIDLPSLLSLDIICLSELVFESGLFTRLSLPELRSFKFSSNSSNYFQEVAFPFLLTSSHLESLDMEVQMFSPQSLVDLLHTVPSTIQLRLHGRFDGRPDPLNDDVLIALTPSSDRPSLGCPILQELHITCCMNVSDEALHRFIVARMTAQATTLRCVNIQFGRAKELDIQSEIQPFLDAGLEVSTRYNETRSIEFSPWRGLLDAPDV